MSSRGLRRKDELLLAARSAGLCQFRGCSERLTEDQLTRSSDNFGAFAHIVAHSPDGPRGDKVRSPLLSDNIENFMVLCLVHHKLIDGDNWRDYPEPMLLEMKAEHEARIRRLTNHGGDQRTHLLLLDARVGPRANPLTRTVAARAVLPLYAQEATEVPLSRLRQEDGERLSWDNGVGELRRAVNDVFERFTRHEIAHISVLALAPIPLLIYLGYRLGDLVPAECFQKRREVADRTEEAEGWRWLDGGADLGFTVSVNDQSALEQGSDVTLVLAVSDDPVITGPVGDHPRITLRVERPGLDIVTSRQQAAAFRHVAREAMQLVARAARVHVVAALPNALSVEFGRVQLPKSHPPLVIYDRHDGRNGRAPVLELHGGDARVLAT